MAPVLQRVQPENGEFRDILIMRPKPEDAASIPGRVVVGAELVGQPTVRLDHPPSLVSPGDALGAVATPTRAEDRQTSPRAGRLPGPSRSPLQQASPCAPPRA